MEGDFARPLDGEAVGTSSRSSVSVVKTGGEPLWIAPNDLAYPFQCEEDQKIGLNKRLPGITQRDVSPSVRFESSIYARRDRPRAGSFAGASYLTRSVVVRVPGEIARHAWGLPSSAHNTHGRAEHELAPTAAPRKPAPS